MAGRLDGQVAIITGASRGLGQYCALGYAEQGAKVVVAARTVTEQDKRLPGTIYHTAEMISEAGGEAIPVVCNVADPASIVAMTEEVLSQFGRIDILMNNAAIQPPGNNWDILQKHWKLIFQVNVHGAFDCVRAVLPTMLAQGSGNIINISSGATQGGSPYGGTKRAVEAMTEGLAVELKDRGITANSLKPLTAIETPGFLFAEVPRGSGQNLELPPPDSYVEAAVLLACQTPDSYTGNVNDDAQVIANLADAQTQQRLCELNPDYWVEAMQASL
jgi:citronellol/citronellal dehydrogenase